MKKLTQAVFDDAPDWVKSAAVDSDGEANLFESNKDTLRCRQYGGFWSKGVAGTRRKVVGLDYDTTDWENSAIDREYK